MSDSLLSNVRYPSVPLIVHDPYFSIWSAHDHLNDGWESHWTGSGVGLCGLLRVDGSCCTFAGEPGLPGDSADRCGSAADPHGLPV